MYGLQSVWREAELENESAGVQRMGRIRSNQIIEQG